MNTQSLVSTLFSIKTSTTVHELFPQSNTYTQIVPDSIPLIDLIIKLQQNHIVIKPVPISDGLIKRYP
jgi:hypothetical protein